MNLSRAIVIGNAVIPGLPVIYSSISGMAKRFPIGSLHLHHLHPPHPHSLYRFLCAVHSFPINANHFSPTTKIIAPHPAFIPSIAPLLYFPCCLFRSVYPLHAKLDPLANSSCRALPPSCMPTNSWAPCGLTRGSHSSSELTQSTLLCWSCGEKISNKSSVICPSCNAVQKPDPSIDYFQMFDLDRKYELDPKDLEGKYKDLMKKLHPDLFHGKSPEEQANSAYLAAVVTRAYDELLKPVSRATYLLKLQGIHVEEEGTVNDPDLIMEVMEIRETLEQTSDRKTLQQLCDTAKMRMDEWIGSFTTAWKEGNLTAAIAALQRMSYFSRVFEDIRWKLL